MNSDESGSGGVHALRPQGHLFRQFSIALVAFSVPIFTVLFWLTIPYGPWPAVLLVLLAATLLYAIAALAAFRAVIWVDRSAVTERGFFGRTETIPLSRIGGIVMLELYQSSAVDTNPQLFLTDGDERLLLRMRGQFWSRDDMETLAEALGVPLVRIAEPMTLRDLNRVRPELLFWFERRFVCRAR